MYSYIAFIQTSSFHPTYTLCPLPYVYLFKFIWFFVSLYFFILLKFEAIKLIKIRKNRSSVLQRAFWEYLSQTSAKMYVSAIAKMFDRVRQRGLTRFLFAFREAWSSYFVDGCIGFMIRASSTKCLCYCLD